MRVFHIFSFFVLCIAMLQSGFAYADVTPWASDDQARARIFSSVKDIAPDTESVDLALEIDFGQGWHSYWVAPGDAGLAPRFSWEASENLKNIEVFYPAPERKDEVGFTVFGYGDKVSLPLRATLEEVGAPLKLALDLDVMVCHEICIPQKMNLELALNKGERGQSAYAPKVERSFKTLPQETLSNLEIKNVVSGPEALVLNIYDAQAFEKDFDVYAYLDDGAYALTAVPEIIKSGEDAREALVKIAAPDGESMTSYLSGKSLHIVVKSGKDAVYKNIDF